MRWTWSKPKFLSVNMERINWSPKIVVNLLIDYLVTIELFVSVWNSYKLATNLKQIFYGNTTTNQASIYGL